MKHSIFKMKSNGALLSFVPMVFLALAPLTTFAQERVANQLTFEKHGITTFAISNDVQIDDMHPFDMLAARTTEEKSIVEMEIFQNGKSRLTQTFVERSETAEGEFDLPSKTVSDDTGTRLYDATGQMMHHMVHDETHPFPIFDEETLSQNGFGMREKIQALSESDLVDDLDQTITIVVNENGSYEVLSDDMRLTFNPNEQSIYEEYYQEGRVIESYYQKFGIVDDNNIMLVWTLRKTYSPLKNGGIIERSEHSIYDNLIVNGKPIHLAVIANNDVRFQNIISAENFNTALIQFDARVLDAKEKIKATLKSSTEVLHVAGGNSNESIDYNILTLDGRIILSGRISLNSDISIRNLVSGIYIISLSNKDGVTYSQFVKN